ncbi:hypothetical protein [uncultured Brevundimonas sp.]|uniref:hypothetical protein n=1 Tax=uncultured Brevundimonas sp. TaxID=213418 RepID=UPI0026234DFD|nr:hypothetical protein [uncultured Brevundimonas sp.]
MIAVLSGLVAALIAAVVVVLMMGWGERLSASQRVGLCAMTAGLVWAGPARFLGHPPGAGDLLFVTGILASLLATHGRAIWRTADALDGAQDGRVRIDWRGWVARVRRRSAP